MIIFRVDKSAVKKAAKFLLKKNPSILTWPDFRYNQNVSVESVYDVIMKCVINGATMRTRYLKNDGTSDEWSGWQSTGGYTIIYTAEFYDSTGDWVMEAEVTVDPAVMVRNRKYHEERLV
jgi:ribosomal protein S17E